MLFSGTEFSVWTSTRGATDGLKGEKGREEREREENISTITSNFYLNLPRLFGKA